MTSYQGGKKKIGKQIYKIILDIESKLSDTPLPYIEPFCGMCGVLIHFAKDDNKLVQACDVNADIIEMWRALQTGWIPSTECSKEYYNKLKESKETSAERGFFGVVCSFGGQFFKGSYRTHTSKHDFIKSGIKGVSEAASIMKNVEFLDSRCYTEFNLSGYLIYCDPPYVNNAISTSTFQNFDHAEFWETMRTWSKNNIVIISEKEAPDDFKCVW